MKFEVEGVLLQPMHFKTGGHVESTRQAYQLQRKGLVVRTIRPKGGVLSRFGVQLLESHVGERLLLGTN